MRSRILDDPKRDELRRTMSRIAEDSIGQFREKNRRCLRPERHAGKAFRFRPDRLLNKTSGQGRQVYCRPLAADGLRRHPRMTSQKSHACRLPGLLNAPANDVPHWVIASSQAIFGNSPSVRCLRAHGGRFPGRRLVCGSARRALVGRPPIQGRRQESAEPNPNCG
jgi:hypothetical protein